MHKIEEVIVIGSGNWGLALAAVFSSSVRTRIWALDAPLAKSLNAARDQGDSPVPYPIPDDIVIEEKYTSDFDENSVLFILAVPSAAVRAAAAELGGHTKQPLVMSVSKGFDSEHFCTMSDVIKHEIPAAVVLVLTGPTIANEVGLGMPTRAVLSSDDLFYLAMTKEALKNDVLGLEIRRHPVQHEICAALKGLVAIAIGMAEQLNLGANAQGIIMCQGLKEIAEVASFFDIPEDVAMGTSGAADLIATCISPNSRNRRLGGFLAQGLSVEQALVKVGMTVEGVAMSRTIETLWSLDISIPLLHLVNASLIENRRDIKAELHRLITGS